MRPADLADLVRAAAEKHRADPVDAVYLRAYNTVIPEMNGYRIDQQATLARLMAALPAKRWPRSGRSCAPQSLPRTIPTR